MEGYVKIELRSIVSADGQWEELHQTGRGLLTTAENGWRLRYVAADEVGEKSQMDIYLTAEGAAVRNCIAGYTMYLQPGQTTDAKIQTPYGWMDMRACTRRVHWNLDGDEQGTIELEYTLLAGSETVTDLCLCLQLSKE